MTRFKVTNRGGFSVLTLFTLPHDLHAETGYVQSHVSGRLIGAATWWGDAFGPHGNCSVLLDQHSTLTLLRRVLGPIDFSRQTPGRSP